MPKKYSEEGNNHGTTGSRTGNIRNTRRHSNNHEVPIRGWSSFRPSKETVEPQNAGVHIRPQKRNPHHWLTENTLQNRRSRGISNEYCRSRQKDSVCRDKKAGSGHHNKWSWKKQLPLYIQQMAWRNSYEFSHNPVTYWLLSPVRISEGKRRISTTD